MTSPTRKKVLGAVGVAAAAVLVGGGTMAAAANNTPSAGVEESVTATTESEAPGSDTPESEGQDAAAAEATESAALAPLATISEADATAAAIAAVPGTAGAVSLGDEDGYVVWSVEITQQDGTLVDVTVDAGNATILAQKTGDEADDTIQ